MTPDLDAIMNETLAYSEVAYQHPEIIDPSVLRMDDPSARIRLSHSTNSLLRGCERKFQKTRLLLSNVPRDNSPATVFGKAYGSAAQHYMVLRTLGEPATVALDSAIYEAFLNYDPPLEDDKRFIERVIYCLQVGQAFHEQQLMEWEIAELNGKMASELSFKIEINAKYYYVGYLDLVLKHRRTGRYAVTDYKTTSMRGEDLSPAYKFSDQVLGYTMILDAAAGAELAEFDTNYWVCQLPSTGLSSLYQPSFKSYTFPKTIKDRFEWFLKLYLDVNYLDTLSGLSVYPRRANHCKAYNQVCKFFNECQFTAGDQPGIYTPDGIDYQFTYNLDELFKDHQERLAALEY